MSRHLQLARGITALLLFAGMHACGARGQPNPCSDWPSRPDDCIQHAASRPIAITLAQPPLTASVALTSSRVQLQPIAADDDQQSDISRHTTSSHSTSSDTAGHNGESLAQQLAIVRSVVLCSFNHLGQAAAAGLRGIFHQIANIIHHGTAFTLRRWMRSGRQMSLQLSQNDTCKFHPLF